MTTPNRSGSNTRVIRIGTGPSEGSGSSSSHAEQADSEYSLVRVEQLDQTAPPQQQRHNSWRYTGPDGLPYRTRATFDTGFRVRLQEFGGARSGTYQQRGNQWFNAVQPGGDADLPDFQCWARQLLSQGLVHADDVQSWKSTFLDVEGGGRGQYWFQQLTAPGAPL